MTKSWIPLWLIHMFTKEQWKMVKIIEAKIKTHTIPPENGNVYFYLYESDRGARKFESSSDIININKDCIPNLKTYNQIIYPWSKGKYFPDIPAFKDMDSEDLMAKLSE